MCVVLVYFLTLRLSIFEKNMLDDILVALLTKHHMIKAERAQTKIGNDAIGYRRKLPSVEITLPRFMFFKEEYRNSWISPKEIC